MRKIVGLFFLVAIFVAGCMIYVPAENSGPPGLSPSQGQGYAPDQWNYNNQDISDFYGYLGPYGLWVSYSPYGYVWMPRNIEFGWRPYALGQWIWSDCGWTWLSTERWGWLVYHYGRWGWDASLGWFWVPDNVWGPAWVAWRWGDAYIGWAPLPPGGDFVAGFGFRRWNVPIPGRYWNFVRGTQFMDRSLDRWILPSERNVTIINYTRLDVNIRVRENRVVNEGLNVDFVHRMTNQVIERRQLTDARQPGEARLEARDVVLFRPTIRQNVTARPKNVFDRSQAASRIETERTGLLHRTPGEEQSILKQNHERESRLLEQSQTNEIQDIQRQAEARKASVRSAAEKQRIDNETRSRISELRKKHATEKAQLAERQNKEDSRVKKPKKK